MALKVARRGAIPPFLVMEVMRAAYEREVAGGQVLHLEVGQPSTGAPKGVIAAAKAALDSELLGYTDALGLPALRAAVSRHYARAYGLGMAAERIAMTTGASGAFLLAFLAAFEPGDRVALALPGYPGYRHILSALGIEPVLLETTAATRFQPSIEVIERAGDIDGLIVASPSNPAGTMLAPQELERIVLYCSAQGIRFVSDEIYHGITFGETAATAAAYSDDAIVINSFSKYFSMTGWRLG